ncbi:hypothetical protein SAMN05443377_1302 [Propionibacterium cyclohexanicum]|uniref:Uncharacterized protein n=1 Tax=Propionibacterium cyclohexanicum TaxID=64702 RepID=A0A1H9TVC1_9ACTN|nr:hypothetical protein [Propionibacterium cyclohexanicum]SES01310.1 hypothetical protein SAMN05443377_1302 [Propionibacterium cyclohexanicum]
MTDYTATGTLTAPIDAAREKIADSQFDRLNRGTLSGVRIAITWLIPAAAIQRQ